MDPGYHNNEVMKSFNLGRHAEGVLCCSYPGLPLAAWQELQTPWCQEGSEQPTQKLSLLGGCGARL